MSPRRITASVALALSILIIGVAPAQAKPDHPRNTTTTVVRGAFANDLPCILPGDVTPHPDDPTQIDFTCTYSVLYAGGFDGRTVGTLTATADATTGNMGGDFEEWFYGTYSGEDGSFGGIHYAGTFTVDGKTSTFTALARIDAGTCSFAGAGGRASFDGMATHGGFVFELERPAQPPDSSPTCPVDAALLPVD